MRAPEILVVIPARGGSRRVPLKNIAPVAGRPSLAHAVDALREATTPLRCVLLTDHPRIAAIARDLGLEVLDEPSELATDDSVDEATLIHYALERTETPGRPFRHVLLHYACVPIRPPGIVDAMVRFLDDTGAEFVQTAAAANPHHHPYRCVTPQPNGRMTDFVPGASQLMSQDYPAVFFRTAAGVGLRRDTLTKSPAISDPNRPVDRCCLIHAEDECVDIDEPRDIMWAEFLLQCKAQRISGKRP